MKKSITICSFGKCYITLVTMLLLALSTATEVEADMIYQRPTYDDINERWSMYAQDTDMYFGLLVDVDSLQNFSGTGRIVLFSLSISTKSSFEFGFINPTTLTLPDTWNSSYNSSNGNLTIYGNILAGGGENINFTFDPTNVVFGRTDFNYYGGGTNRILPDVDTLTVVPVPSAVILGSLGLTFSGWLLHRKKKT